MARKVTTDILKYNPNNKTFYVSGKDIQFATSYEVINPKTGNSEIFDFKESTGSEWDPNTVWIYKCKDMQLHVLNDDVTQEHINNYLKAKTR